MFPIEREDKTPLSTVQISAKCGWGSDAWIGSDIIRIPMYHPRSTHP